MKKNKIIQTIALSLCVATGCNMIIPSISASASEINVVSYEEIAKRTGMTAAQFNNASQIEILDENTISIDGEYYDFDYVANILSEEIDANQPLTRNAASPAVKKAAKWVVENWTKIYKKIPDKAKKYFKFDSFMKVMDQFLSISDSIEDFFHSCFRAMGMPEWANWAITNVIMLLLPI